MKMLNTIIRKIKRIMANRSHESRLRYLNKLGCVVGKGTRFMNFPVMDEPYLVEIGEDCAFSTHVRFITHDGGVKVLNTLGFFGNKKMDKMARIKIGNNCMVGTNSFIHGGVTIGNNCIIGACSVVTKDIPDGMVAAGIPAKVICTIEEYYEKNLSKGNFYDTTGMNSREKREYLSKHVK